LKDLKKDGGEEKGDLLMEKIEMLSKIFSKDTTEPIKKCQRQEKQSQENLEKERTSKKGFGAQGHEKNCPNLPRLHGKKKVYGRGGTQLRRAEDKDSNNKDRNLKAPPRKRGGDRKKDTQSKKTLLEGKRNAEEKNHGPLGGDN